MASLTFLSASAPGGAACLPAFQQILPHFYNNLLIIYTIITKQPVVTIYGVHTYHTAHTGLQALMLYVTWSLEQPWEALRMLFPTLKTKKPGLWKFNNRPEGAWVILILIISRARLRLLPRSVRSAPEPEWALVLLLCCEPPNYNASFSKGQTHCMWLYLPWELAQTPN